ncbi:hydroxyacid dehydrogenase [Ammoniphilus oxalaticus]|uniref:Hydroxyacid dehydrogenase n=1 Tax=Ammoniphilus oxalaticus TaxID=66863 RepID=A0A419SHH1_9BACL|nr:C-terminal binding protein [Ammoniphilus oxalaticus]RKD23229.1 hydroxyacid dehydrogenase [Ammoniphilus oxalaticus]
MGSWKVVVTDFDYADVHPEEEVLDRLGITLIKAQCRSEADVIEICKDADGVLTQYAPFTREVIEQLDKCKVISRYGIGVDTVDLAAATEKGIIVSNVTDYCIDEVSDHAMAFLLACARKTVVYNQAVKQGVWDYKVGMPMFRLRGRALGLVGLGRIPQQVARKAQAFGMRVIAYDPYLPEHVARDLNVELVDLNTLCEQADFISIHTPLTEATRGFIGPEQFRRMKPEAVIINTARGPIINEQAMINALESGAIAGAGLDVLEQEPIPADHPFMKMDQVILNPHAAWHSNEAQEELKRKVAENVVDVLSGYWPRYLVNREVREKVKLKEKSPTSE